MESTEWAEEELTTKEALMLLDELSYLNRDLMIVLSGGEPMIRQDILEIVSYASEGGFITVMGSNGTLLDRRQILLLKEAGLSGLGISIDSAERTSHDLFRGIDGAWDAAMDSLKCAAECGIETQVNTTITEQNIHQLQELVDLAAELDAKAINFFFLICTGRAMRTGISLEGYEAALRKIIKLSRVERRLMVRVRCAPHVYRLMREYGPHIYKGSRGCMAGRHYMRIDPEGYVTPCPYMDLRVGSIRERSLTEIWENSEVLISLRLSSYSGRCGICEYREICGGCRARAILESGDLLGEDTLCSYSPSGGKDVLMPEDHPNFGLPWDEEAAERMKRIPAFLRGRVISMLEAKAEEMGIGRITSRFIDEFKAHSPHGGS
jgi:radical SAM protein with 4Fe4S-binding SPASM domain